MRKIAALALVIAALSFVLAVISRITGQPIIVMPSGVQAVTFLNFANTCLLAAIAFILLELARKK